VRQLVQQKRVQGLTRRSEVPRTTHSDDWSSGDLGNVRHHDRNWTVFSDLDGPESMVPTFGRPTGRVTMPGLGRSDPSPVEAGAPVLQRHRGEAQDPIAERAQAPATAEVIQRVIAVNQGNHTTISTEGNRKLQQVINDLTQFGTAYGNNYTVNLTVDDDGGTNPAETSRAGNNITIGMRRWFLEMSSVGEIMGMLAHELGVHSLADLEMGGGERAYEEFLQSAPRQETRNGRQYDLAAYNDGNETRQMDHVNATQRGSFRNQKYITTVLRMGDAIEADANRSDEQKIKDQQELVKTFGFDMGRILATDDGGAGKVLLKSGDIAHIQNEEIDHLVTNNRGAHPWLDNLGFSRGLGVMERLNPFSRASMRERMTGVGDIESSGLGNASMLTGKVKDRAMEEPWRLARQANDILPAPVSTVGSFGIETTNTVTNTLMSPGSWVKDKALGMAGFGVDMVRGNARALWRGIFG